MNDSAASWSELADDLSELFGETVSIEGGERRQVGGAELAIVEMGYTSRSRSGSSGATHTTRIRQTAIVSKDAELDLPQFSLSPTPTGLAGSLLSVFGDMGDIDFDDSPVFSEQYQLIGWAEEPVRLLFTPELRQFFTQHPGWSVMGKKRLLVIFEHNCVQDDRDRPKFIDEGLEIASLFQKAEEKLDAMPDVRRDVTATDMAQTAERMGGPLGFLLSRQLNKIRLTSAELQRFLAQPPPRSIPAGMKKQVLGDNVMLIVLGLFFMLAGLVVGGSVTAMAHPSDRWIGLIFVILFPLIGGSMAFFTIRYRARKRRTLQDGRLVDATVESVKRSNTQVNGQYRYHVKIHYDGSKSTVLNVYAAGVDKAKTFAESGEPMRVLIDPKKPQHVVAPELLIVFD